jgi:hypothetical protein
MPLYRRLLGRSEFDLKGLLSSPPANTALVKYRVVMDYS